MPKTTKFSLEAEVEQRAEKHLNHLGFTALSCNCNFLVAIAIEGLHRREIGEDKLGNKETISRE